MDERAIARVRAPSGPVGAGCLVAPNLVVTCAHVVAMALGLPLTVIDAPTDYVIVDFPFADRVRTFRSRVVRWSPMPAAGGTDPAALDVAGLEVIDLDLNLPTLPLIAVDDCWAEPIRVVGFPAHHDLGVWTAAVLRGPLINGWIQIEDTNPVGYRVEGGYSGSPIWHEGHGGVVGLVVSTDADPAIRAAFVLPCGLAFSPWSELAVRKVETRPHLKRQPLSRASSRLRQKMVAAGATEEMVEDGLTYRANATRLIAEYVHADLSQEHPLVEDVRLRLRGIANPIAASHRALTDPAPRVWQDLLAALSGNPSVIDPNRIFKADPFALLGEVCEISDHCEFGWGR